MHSLRIETRTLLVVIILIAASCQKDKVTDSRDRFVGTWEGTFTYSVPVLPGWSGTRANHAYFTKGPESDELLVKNFGISYYAIVRLNYNQYTYSSFEIGSSTCYTTELLQYSGSGSLSGNQITETGKMVVSVNGQESSGTWETRMIRTSTTIGTGSY
jgi:hypothetical protein